MNETIDDLLKSFEERAVSIQITLDYGISPMTLPTVHAMYQGEIYKTTGQTVLYCLQRMKEKLFG